MISLKGKRALVTGGSRGIGADVGIAYRSRSSDAATVVADITSHKVRSFSHMVDLSTKDGNDAFVDKAVHLFGGVDIYVGNSGFWPPDPLPISLLDDDRWRVTMATNLDGMFYGARAAARVMGDGGRMIFVSSTAGQRGEAGHADYAATKGAMISFVKSVAVELGSRDITVNAVAPGWVDTEAVEKPFAAGRQRIEAAIPLGRVASPADIAGPILFLASPLARHVTGEILNVNGGSVLCG